MSRRGRLIIGLMSGTSHDGADAVLAKVNESGARIISHVCLPYPKSLKDEIRLAFIGDTARICALDYALGEFYSKAAIKCAKDAGVSFIDIDAIACHGQTICHMPPKGKKPGSTMQIGNPSVISARTGAPVVSGFRHADMALGGHGAPLVPYAEWFLFGKFAPCICQNIGGIANATFVGRNKNDVFAFDTGPGNSLIDAAMRILFKRPFDRNGDTASKGRCDDGLLSRFLRNPYFSKRPPKSTGLEQFGDEMVKGILKLTALSPNDIICTLTHLTARSIALSYKRYILPGRDIKFAVFSGGGVNNLYLMSLIRDLIKPVDMRISDDFGIQSQAKEALCFAVLAYQTLMGRPSNLPKVTGASGEAVLGSITRVRPLLNSDFVIL